LGEGSKRGARGEQEGSKRGARGEQEGSKRIRFPFSHATKAKHPLSSLLAGGNEGGPELGLGDEGEMFRSR